MAAQIDETQVRQIARLARLSLSDEEVRLFAGQLARILDYVAQIDTVATESVEPLAHPFPVTNVVRDDEPGACLSSDAALANAPERHGGFFRVPAVLDATSGA